MINITVQMLITSLRSRTCPACGGSKKSRRTLCLDCWKKLANSDHHDLCRQLGFGYAEAVQAAMEALGATEFKLETPAIELLEVSDLQGRQMVLAAIPAGPRISIHQLFDLHLPKPQLLQILRQLVDSQELISDPENDDGCTIPAFRRSNAWEEVA